MQRPSSPTFGEGKGEGYTAYTGETRFLIQGQLHLCLRKVHPNTRYKSLRAIRILQAASFKRSIARTIYAVVICEATLQRPLLQTSPSPWPSAFPLPLHPLEEEGGPINRDIAIQTKTSYLSVGLSLLSKGLRGGMSRSDRVESLLRWMIASEDAKNPLKAPKQKGIQGCRLRHTPGSEG